jgi:hypothetical protein
MTEYKPEALKRGLYSRYGFGVITVKMENKAMRQRRPYKESGSG